MNSIRTGRDGFASRSLIDPETRPEVNFRAAETSELERLKQRLLREKLAEETNGELTVPLRRAANEAAALSWVTTHPLLVFPALFEEKARIARRQYERQLVVRARSRELMAA